MDLSQYYVGIVCATYVCTPANSQYPTFGGAQRCELVSHLSDSLLYRLAVVMLHWYSSFHRDDASSCNGE